MDRIQEQHEQATGAAFIEWYNRQHGTAFRYHSRGADPPDLAYRCGNQEMFLEITSAYYDADNATMSWQDARGVQGLLTGGWAKTLTRSLSITLMLGSQRNTASHIPLIVY